jgi:hypothetical protein
MEWLPKLQALLGIGSDLEGHWQTDSVSKLVHALRELSASPSFLQQLQSTNGALEQEFLVTQLASLVARCVTAPQLADLARTLQEQGDEVLLGALVSNVGPKDSGFTATWLPTLACARLHSLREALYKQCPEIRAQGYVSQQRLPVFYLPERALGGIADWVADLREGLLISDASCQFIPSRRNVLGGDIGMDMAFLEHCVMKDKASGHLPVAVCCMGEDTPNELRKVCDKHQLWLHLEGDHNVLIGVEDERSGDSTPTLLDMADSVVLAPLSWYGVSHSMGVALIRGARGGRGVENQSSRPAQPTRVDFRSTFLLWYQLLSRSTRCPFLSHTHVFLVPTCA